MRFLWKSGACFALVLAALLVASVPAAGYHTGTITPASLTVNENVSLPINNYTGYTFSLGLADSIAYSIQSGGDNIDVFFFNATGLAAYRAEPPSSSQADRRLRCPRRLPPRHLNSRGRPSNRPRADGPQGRARSPARLALFRRRGRALATGLSPEGPLRAGGDRAAGGGGGTLEVAEGHNLPHSRVCSRHFHGRPARSGAARPDERDARLRGVWSPRDPPRGHAPET